MTAGHRQDVVSVLSESLTQRSSDQARGTGDSDFHVGPLVARKYTLEAGSTRGDPAPATASQPREPGARLGALAREGDPPWGLKTASLVHIIL